jgi:Uncharacterized conserved protein, contains double-stranded beta-helix domain
MNSKLARMQQLPRHTVGEFLRVLACVIALAATGSTSVTAQESADRPIAVDPATLKFEKIPNAPACATSAAVRGDPNKGPSVLLQKLSAGCRAPWHWHTPNEQVMMVSGSGQFEMKGAKPLQLVPGAYVFLPSHHVHRISCSSDCVLFVASDTTFDIHYVDEAGKEISADEALKGLK